MKCLLLFLLLPSIAPAQSVIKGKIIDFATKEPIPFVTVGLTKQNIGTNASKDGLFNLVIYSSTGSDTLIFSSIGYNDYKLPISDELDLENISIELFKKAFELPELILSSNKTQKTVSLNDFSKCGNGYIGSSGFQTQLAQHFRLDKANAMLSSVKICRFSIKIVAPEKTIFRIRVYGMDSLTKAPSEDLCDQIIEVKTGSKITNVNLEKYKIFIPDKDFFVAIEWLKIPYNEVKSTIKTNGRKTVHISYKPSIGWSNNINREMEAWMLDYRNIWQPMFKMNDKTSVSISATVKY